MAAHTSADSQTPIMEQPDVSQTYLLLLLLNCLLVVGHLSSLGFIQGLAWRE